MKMSDVTKIRNFATLVAARDQMEENEIAYVRESGVETLVVKKSEDDFKIYSDLTADLVSNSFASVSDLITEVARFRDHGLTDEEP
jgi:hypothetical protein